MTTARIPRLFRTVRCVRLLLVMAAIGGTNVRCDSPTLPEETAPPTSAPVAPPPPPPAPEPEPPPPATPTGLMVSGTTENSITWTWNAVEGATAYVVQVSANEMFGDADDQTHLALMPTFTAAPLPPNTTVYVRVAAAIGTSVEDALLSAWTTHVTGMSAAPPPPPATPTGLMVSGTTENSITWTWNAVEGATAYVVQVSANEMFGDADDQTHLALMPTFTAAPLPPNTTVYVRVAAAIGTSVEDALLSAWTTHVTGMSVAPPPPPFEMDHRATVQCDAVHVTASQPRRIDDGGDSWVCNDTYSIDVSVTTRATDALAFDLLRRYPFSDWRVRVDEGLVHHELRVYWNPYLNYFENRSSIGGVPPMTVAVCPEGGQGPVIACDDRSCRTYADEDSVPAMPPSTLAGEFRSPWGYSDLRELREGETLEVIVEYEFPVGMDYLDFGVAPFRPLGEGSVWDDIEIRPRKHVLENVPPGSGTLTFHVEAKADGLAETEEREVIVVQLIRWASRLPESHQGRSCLSSPNSIRLQILDPP